MTSRPDLESLTLLVLVGRWHSLTAAAAEAGISQPAASKRLSALERKLGVRLIERSKRGSALTSAGEVVCGWAQRVLGEVDALVRGAEALRHESGHLTVAASLTVAEHLLPGWLGELRRSAPELRVGLQVMNSTRVCELVLHGEIELGFIESPGAPTGLRTRCVSRDRLVLVVSPQHPWARRRRPVTAAELARTPLVSREEGSGTRETAQRALAGLATVPPLLELGSSAAVRSSVLAGAGPALISELIVAADLTAGVLTEVRTEDLSLARDLRAVWRAGTKPAGAAADLLACALRSDR
jgi:DNA-binding transcriptional LysR family regulator